MYLVAQEKKTPFFAVHFYDIALRFNPNYRFDPECPPSVHTTSKVSITHFSLKVHSNKTNPTC
jgi:hypothetical protein